MSQRPRSETPPRGVVVLREAAALLKGMTFTSAVGDAARGKWVSVTLVPSRSADDTLTVDISCRPSWPQTVSWHKLALWARPLSSNEARDRVAPVGQVLGLLPPLDDRGHVALPGLPSNHYAIRVGERAGQDLLVEPPAQAVAVRGAVRRSTDTQEDVELKARLVARRGDERDVVWSAVQVYRSSYERISATILPMSSSIEVAFETDDPTMEGRVVRFSFLDAESGAVNLNGEASFGPVPDTSNLWEAVWLGEGFVRTPSDFVYELLSVGADDV